MITTATIGKGKAIHAMRTTGPMKGSTLCLANDYDLTRGLPAETDAPAVTCKRCLKAMAADAEKAYDVALKLDEERTLYRARTNTPSGEPTDWAAVEAVTDWERKELHLVHMLSGERHVFEGSEHSGSIVHLRNLATGGLHRMAGWVLLEDYTAVCEHQNGPRELCEGCGETDEDSNQLDGAPAEAGEAEAPQQDATVPNTVEAWEAYADRVKASRDAAEAEVARLLRELGELADFWERNAHTLGTLPQTPWAGLRAILDRTGGDQPDYQCGDRVRVARLGQQVDCRVTFISSARDVFHVKPLDGGMEFVTMRDKVRRV